MTCCKCSIIKEHTYCMLRAFPDTNKDWFCKYCLNDHQEKHLHQTSTDQIMEKNSSPWLGKSNQSKVKFIAPAEAISLMDRNRLTRRRNITSSHCSLTLKAKEQSKDENRPTAQRSVLIGAGYSHPPLRRFDPSPALVRNTEFPNAMKSGTVLNSRANKEDKNPPAVQEPEYTMGSHTSVERHDVRSTLVMDRNVVFSNVIKSLNVPVQQACWKGICDVSSTDFHVLCNMEAYFPLQVYYKVFEATRQMPTELKSEVGLRKYMWPKIFVDDPPTSHDVGLYFLATEINRHGKKSASLVEYLDANDLALRCPIGNAELIIYTSSWLPAEEKELPMRFNLWGIFHSLKSKKKNTDLQNQLAEGELACQVTPKMAPDSKGKKAMVPEPSAKLYRQIAGRNGNNLQKGFSGGPSHSKKNAALTTDREDLHRQHHSGAKRPIEQSDKTLNKELKLRKSF